MSAQFPSAIYTGRSRANLPGISYDSTKDKVVFAEDLQNWDNEINALEVILGTNPQWSSASLKERIKGIRSLSDATEDLITIKGGNVGIGTTNPVEKLQVAGAVKVTGSMTADTASSGGFDYLSTGLRLFSWGASGSTKGTYQFIAKGADGSSSTPMVINNAGNVGIGTTGPTAKADILSDILRLRTAKTPASAGSAGNQGDICWDSSYLYICVATNTWLRSLFTTWV